MTEKVYVTIDNRATFICPSCEAAKTVDVSGYIKTLSAVNVNCKCKCGKTFAVILERRKYYRKGIHLNGKIYLQNSDIPLNVTVKDISRSGIKLTMNAEHPLTIGEQLKLVFRLDDKRETEIQRDITVISIKGINIGAQFPSFEHYDKLGQFLLFN